ncbi:hypothetical protein HDV05_002755 [Chytridiales sp. JEL 0842]|nr:hypothetical protein HDV05_002755 [Chytridiales sp. JEL 0842]
MGRSKKPVVVEPPQARYQPPKKRASQGVAATQKLSEVPSFVQGQPIWVASLAELDSMINAITGCTQLAMDMEGDLSSMGHIDLLQIATATVIYLVDVFLLLRKDKQSTVNKLKRLLENPTILKVFHDGRADSEAAYALHGIQIHPILDTQLLYMELEDLQVQLAANNKLHRSTMPAPASSSGLTAAQIAAEANTLSSDNSRKFKPGLNKILERAGMPINAFKNQVHRIMDSSPHGRALWQQRPMQDVLVSYAADDVRYLLQAKEHLMEEMQKVMRDLLGVKSARYAGEKIVGGGGLGGSMKGKAGRHMVGVDMFLRFEEGKNENGAVVLKGVYEPAPLHWRKGEDSGDGGNDDGLVPKDEEVVFTASNASVNSTNTPLTPETDIDTLLAFLPDSITASLTSAIEDAGMDLTSISELMFDVGRVPEARFFETPQAGSGKNRTDVPFLDRNVTFEDIESICERLSFGPDRRAGIEGQLHRISVIESRDGRKIGLTMRVARVVVGSAGILKDFLSQDKSVLVVGMPGKGKTTLLRDIARLVSTDIRKTTIVVDTSNEVGGDGYSWHTALGKARRMQVGFRNQNEVMLEAVKNHSPQTLIIDELGKKSECQSTRTIVQRGVQLIATAHGSCLRDILANPDLDTLVGGKSSVILGDAAASKQARGKDRDDFSSVRKTATERAGDPTFSVVVELFDRGEWIVHLDVGGSVDALLAGEECLIERRWVDNKTGRFMARKELMR